jgi:uncharacterized membrane protein HdeD (DUF308 family)
MHLLDRRFSMLLEALTRNWWMVVLRGVVALLFGVLAWVRPGITLGALVLLFGAYALLDGVLSLVAAVTGRTGKPWWALLLAGIAGLAAAAVAFFAPGLTALALLYLIAAWAIITGVMEVVAAIALRKEIQGEWLLALAGIASLVFGFFLVARPGAGALAVIWLIGSYAFAFGILLIGLGFRLKGLRNRFSSPRHA